MHYRQKKTLRILLVILLALAALLAGLKACGAPETPAPDASGSAETVTDEAAYTSIAYSNGTASLSFARGEDDQWYWVDDPEFPLDGDYLTKLVNTLSALTPQQTITDGDALETYGLDEPSMTLTASAPDGTTLTCALGNQVAGGSGSYYLLLNGAESPIYVVDASLHDQLALGVYDMMALPALPVLLPEDIASITVEGAQETMLSATVSESAASGSSAESAVTVTWRSGGGNVTDNESAQSLIGAVSALSLGKCQDFRPTDAAVKLCGFDAPRAVARVRCVSGAAVDHSFVLTVGAAAADGSGLYVRLEGDDTIYSMPEEELAPILSVADGGLSA